MCPGQHGELVEVDMSKYDKPYEARRTEKLVDGEWVEFEFLDLKEGDIFRMMESDTGEMVCDNDGNCEWTATGDAYVDPESKVGTIKCDLPAQIGLGK